MPRFDRQPSPRRVAAGALLGALLATSGALFAAPDPGPAAAAPKPAPAPEGAAAAPAPTPEAIEFFEKQIRPVLAEQCYACHSAKLKAPMGSLRLDSRAGLLKGGDLGPSIVPGSPEKSTLIRALHYGDRELQMPPKGKLPQPVIAAFEKWIAMGAPWPAGAAPAPAPAEGGFNLQERARHWSYQPLKRVTPPAVKRNYWPRTSVDRFILAGLEAKGLAPAQPADRRTLIRRAYFDVIGLPPTPEEVEAFVTDRSPDAWEKVVDRLLASPHYGERWARHWLDLVRFGETRGHEFDPVIPNAYHYRDYVIRAFNADVPYPQLVMEHLAGDLLEKSRLHPSEGFNESILGTGFWFLGEEVHAPVDTRQDETDRLDNRIDTMSKAFLGLTVGCARCHDHKFDAISQKDYYALAGFLHSSTYRQVPFEGLEQNRRVAEQLERLRREAAGRLLPEVGRAARPAVEGLAPYLTAALEALAAGAKGDGSAGSRELSAPVAARHGLDAALLERWTGEVAAAREQSGHPLHAFARVAGGAPEGFAERLAALRAEWERAAAGASPEAQQVIVDYAKAGPESWWADGFTFGLGPVRPGEIVLGDSPERPVAEVIHYGAARRFPAWNGLKQAPGNQVDHGRLGSWERPGRTIRTPRVALKSGSLYYLVRGAGRAYAAVDSHLIVAPPLHARVLLEWDGKPGEWQWVRHDLTPYKGHRAHIEFTPRTAEGELVIARVIEAEKAPVVARAPNPLLGAALADGSVTGPEALARAYGEVLGRVAATLASGSPGAGEAEAELASWLASRPELFAAGEGRERLIEAARPLVERRLELVRSIRTESRSAPAMLEGNRVDEFLLIRGSHRTPGETVPRRFLEALGGTRRPPSEQGSGRLDMARQVAEHPLTARVIVNRVWQHLFGEGIVRTPDDFGSRGEAPSHPELLDWLASEFLREGGSIKKLQRSLLLSSTYQQGSRPGPGGAARDPQNRLLHRMPVRRLEAEIIRDALLAISGRLDRKMYGPSVLPYLTPFTVGRGRPDSGPLDGDGRRSIYINVRRNFLTPLFLAFDFPAPFSTIGRRSVSTVPAQALALMNNPLVVQQSEVWARRLLAEGRSPEGRLERAYLMAFARRPTEAERAAALAFLAEQQHRRGGGADEAAAWADLCHVLVNAKEFIFIR